MNSSCSVFSQTSVVVVVTFVSNEIFAATAELTASIVRCSFCDADLPPPPEPPPCQGQNRIPGTRSMAPPTERKAASLERTPMLGGLEEMKSCVDRQTRTSLDQHRQTQDRLGSMDRAEDGRRGQKTGLQAKVLP